jgi:uncharacterized protein YukE
LPNSAGEVPGPAGGYRNAPVSAPSFTSTVPDFPGESSGLSGVLYVDPDALDRAVAVAADAADGAADDAQRLQGALDRSGPAPWGDDPGLGQSFGSAFAGPRDTLRQAMNTLPKVLGDLAGTLQQTRRAFTDVDGQTVTAGGDAR